MPPKPPGTGGTAAGNFSGGGRQKPLGQLLKEMELVTEAQIQESLQIQRKKGGVIGEILVELGYVGKEEILLALAAQMGMEVVDLDELELPPEVITLVPATMAKNYNVIPIKFEDGVLTVAMSNPHDVNVRDDLRANLHLEVQGAVASEEGVQRALEKYYAHQQESLGSVIDSMGGDDLTYQEPKGQKRGAYNVDELVNSAPVVKLLNLILSTAIKATELSGA